MPMSLSREQDTTLHRLFATLLIPLALVLVTIPAQAQRFPTTEELKAEVATEVASLQKLSQEIVDMVFSFSELGFQEFWTLDYLTGILEEEGITVERSEEHTSELQSRGHLVCRLLLEKKEKRK